METSRANLAFFCTLVLGATALLMSWISISNYVDSVQSIRGLTLRIVDLHFTDDDNPRLQIRFRLENPSPLDMQLNSYFFDLSLNGTFVGTTSSSYLGTDPTADVGLYSQATRINRTLPARSALDLDFTLYIAPEQQAVIRQAQQAEQRIWRADTGFWLVFPNVAEEDLIRLQVDFEP